MKQVSVVVVVLGLILPALRGEWSVTSGQRTEATATPPESSSGEASEAAKRGYDVLTTKAFAPPIWFRSAYDTAWKQWGLKEKPADYDTVFRKRYGLHAAPYPNGGLPMGLRETTGLLGKGITNDCMVCHGSSILGKSYVGLGNASLDLESVFLEMAGVSSEKTGLKPFLFTFTNVRGTVEAGAMTVWLLSLREPETLALRGIRADLPYRADLCEDTPPWWHLKKKTRLYYNGSVDARSVRTLMLFALSPFHTLKDIQAMEPAFRDIQAYLKTVEPPKYPGKINTELASVGRGLFEQNCSSCHGTYGTDWTYPNKILPLKEIGTDPNRALAFNQQAHDHYERTWFAAETGPDGKRLEATNHKGYVAPPLDGIWATAPYLHNGSVPTLEHLLNSKTRPARFTRSYQTGVVDYDFERVGWKVTLIPQEPPATMPLIERRKIYDTTQPGRSNRGHTFGDDLTDDERRAVIEYLKAL